MRGRSFSKETGDGSLSPESLTSASLIRTNQINPQYGQYSIRTLLKASKGESISVPPVGVMNDLPSNVTGINKHNDLSERVQERSTKKTE